MLINPAQLNFQDTSSNVLPAEGPKGVPLLLDYSGSVTEYDLDMLIPQQQGYMSAVQSIFIDLSASGAADLVVTVNGTNQQIHAKAGTQGYYPLPCPNPVKLTFVSTSGTAVVYVMIFNVPMSGLVWTA